MNRQQRREQAKQVAKKIGQVLTKTGNIAKATSELLGAEGVTKKAIAGIHLIKAIRGDKNVSKSENPIGWYQKYVVIKPAANYDRPMDPLFNTSITNKATQGSVCRFVDVDMDWTGYADTYMFSQVVEASFRKIRDDLRSNLPYTSKLLKAYLVNAIALTIIAKQFERNIQWNQFAHPSIRNFQKMWRLRPNYRGYGVSTLNSLDYLDPKAETWSQTVSSYQLLEPLFNSVVRVPDSLGRFIGHYFGSVFIDSDDGYADQYIRNTLHNVDWATYSRVTQNGQTVENVEITTLNIDKLTPDDLIDLIDKFQVQFGIVLADLKKSNQLMPTPITKFGEYMYTAIYDKTYLQALINGYTSANNVQANGYVRLDKYKDVEDQLTQFIFMGALQKWSGFNAGQANVPAITILSMTLKYDSDDTIAWPAGLIQQAGNSNGETTFVEPIGVTITSDISADTYVNADLGVASKTLSFGDNEYDGYISIAGGTPVTFTFSRELGEYTLAAIPDGLMVAVLQGADATNNTGYMFVPLIAVKTGTNSGEIDGIFLKYQSDTGTWLFSSPGVIALSGGSAGNFNLLFANAMDTVFLGLGPDTPAASAQLAGFHSLDGDTTATIRFNPTVTQARFKIATNSQLVGQLSTSRSGLVGFGASKLVLKAATSSTVTLTTVTATASQTIANGYLGIFTTGIEAGVISGAYATVTQDTTGNSVAVTSGFTTLAAWVADQFDAHIPMLVKYNTHVYARGASNVVVELDQPAGQALIKEAYIPYYYNILDLVPTLYNMFTSLFDTMK